MLKAECIILHLGKLNSTIREVIFTSSNEIFVEAQVE